MMAMIIALFDFLTFGGGGYCPGVYMGGGAMYAPCVLGGGCGCKSWGEAGGVCNSPICGGGAIISGDGISGIVGISGIIDVGGRKGSGGAGMSEAVFCTEISANVTRSNCFPQSVQNDAPSLFSLPQFVQYIILLSPLFAFPFF